MIALVTGGAGFIGSHITERLLTEGYEVICLDNFDNYYDPRLKRKNIESFLENQNFTLIEGDIRNEELIKNLIQNYSVNYIFHEAAQAGVRASIEDPKKPNDVNIGGTMNVLTSSLDSNVKKIIFASSSSVYGKMKYLPFDEEHPKSPISPYGVSKLAAEYYCRVFYEVYGLKTVSLRYFTVYGPRMRPDLAISIFTRNALENETIEIFGTGSQTRDFTYIDDVVEATMKAIGKGDGEAYNIGSGKRISIIGLAELIIEITHSNSKIIHSKRKKGDAMHTWANIEKAKKELDWVPKIDIKEGLEKYINNTSKFVLR